MVRFGSSRWLAGLAFCLAFSATAHAQAISGDLTGTISDASAAAIPGASVVAVNDATGVKTTAVTDSSGVYRFTNLTVGRYTVTATANGFSASTLKEVELTLNRVSTANMTLSVGAVGSTVEVSASAATIDTTNSQLQTTFATKEVVELPQAASGSGIYNLALLGAGVSTSGGVGQGFGPTVSGQRPDNNSFFLDGVSNNNYYNPAPLVYVSNEAIGEFTLLQNQFSPEFGGGSGGIFTAVVRSGTNQIHGSIYEYLQNRNLNAVDSLNATQGLTSNPRYDNNRLGATIGGPILKNKLFYFGNFEYNPVGQSAVPGSPLYAPTQAGFSALGSIKGVSATNLGILKSYIPAAATNDQASIPVLGQQIPIGSIAFNNPVFTNNYNALVSLDYNVSDKDQLRGRWVYNKQSSIVAAQVPTFNASQPNDNYSYILSEFHNFTPSLQNEFRLSFSRNVNALPGTDLKFPGLDAFPVITIDELNGLTYGPVGPSGSTQNLFQATDNVSKVWGKHTFKFGGDFIDMIASNYFIQRVTGNYEYSSLELYLQDQAPDILGERSAGATSYPVGFLQSAAYANDDYRIRPNLTINLGLRYEYVTVPVASRYQAASAPASVPGGITFGRPYYDKTNFAPRIGFAYAPGNKGTWSIRGGFSQAYDLVYSNLTANGAPPYFQQTNDCPGVKCPATGFLASGGLPGTAVPLPTDQRGALGPVASYTFGGKRPYGLSWTMGLQHTFATNYTFEARYVGTRGVHLWNQTRLNIFPQVSSSNFIPTYLSVPDAGTLASLKTLATVKSFIVPGGTAAIKNNVLASFGSQSNIVGYAPQATSTYHGLALQLNKRFSSGLTYIAAYTWSHLLDDATATNFSTYLTPRRAQNYQNLKADWASSALDRRQRFTFTPIYEWRPFKNGNWLARNILGNWNISGTYTYESPEYATVQSNLDTNLNGDSAGDRTIVNPAGQANVGSGVTGYNAAGQKVAAGSGTIVAYVANNPGARYIVAGSGALANGGRNDFPLHPINNVDTAIKKRFSFGDRWSFDVGAQIYNIFNHAQYTGGFINDVQSRGFTGARNDLVPSDPLFGRFDQFYSSNSRVVQVSAHIVF